MLTHKITYEDFNGNTVTDTLYFNLNKIEIMEINAKHDGGLEKFLDQSLKTEDFKNLLSEFKTIILMSYGEKSEDGKRFVKSPELQKEFSQSLAFDELFTQFLTNEQFMSYFVMEVIPKDFAKQVEEMQKTQTVQLPPPPEEPPKEQNGLSE